MRKGRFIRASEVSFGLVGCKVAALALPPVVGWMGSEKGVSVVLGEVAAPCEKGKGKVSKKWG